MGCTGITRWVAGAMLMAAVTVGAQPAAQGPRANELELEPIRCWWKTDRVSVHVGERFMVTLTCGVVETEAVTVVPALNQLDPGSVQLTPFEVVSGVRHEDVVVTPHRYFQYDYVVRFLGEGSFGQDVALPALTVTYNIRAASGGGLEGRDQRYVLPALPLRVQSLVTRDASDIRDVTSGSLQAVETRRFRATAATVVAAIAFGFAGVLLILALVRSLRHARQRRPVAARPLSAAVVLHGCVSALEAVKTAARQSGWSPELARRALTSFRIAGAVALDRPVAQTDVTEHLIERDGQLLVKRGLVSPKRVLLSAALTAPAIARHLSNGHRTSARTQAAVAPIRSALEAFNAAAYGRNGHPDETTLYAALEQGTDAIRTLRLRRLFTLRRAPAVDTAPAAVLGPSH